MTVDGRVAMITGGGRGIGAATAAALAAAGARVAVASRTEAEIEAVAETLRAGGHAAFAFACDVADEEAVERTMAAAGNELGAIDILVNNAGVALSNPVAKTTLDQWNRMLAVNATGTFLCSRAVVAGMAERGWGRIVNVASTAGLDGARYISAYVASKHAAVGFTRALALEMEGTGVTVNAVCPGWVDTPMTEGAIARVVDKTGLSAEQALAGILEESGQPRLIAPEEVAGKIVEVCAGTMNGEAIVIDGKGG